MTGPDPEPEEGNSMGFGCWGADGNGRPEFYVDITRCPADAWHLVGSPGLLALAHASGRVSLYSTGGGMVRLVDHGFACRIDGALASVDSVMFGLDRCRWEFSSGDTRVTRTLIADPAHATLRLEWLVDAPRAATVSEALDVAAYPLIAGPLMSRPSPPPSTHHGIDRWVWRAMFTGSGLARRVTDAARSRLGSRHPLIAHVGPSGRSVIWQPAKSRRDPGRPTLWLRTPPSLRLTCTSCDPATSIRADAASITLQTPGSGKFVASATIELLDAVTKPRVLAPPVVDVTFPERTPDVLAREARWHVRQLQALRVPDPFIGHSFVMQGSAYGFLHGLHGALRDEAFVVAALARLDPVTAREALVSMASLAKGDGTFHYAHTGFGAAASGGIHAAPTDLGLFFVWALTAYIDATGDHAVLDETVRLRGQRNATGRIGALAVQAVAALETSVGIGPHGMLRVGSGDWADPISLMVPRRRAFHQFGESTFNTAMALAALPGAERLFDAVDPTAARRCRRLCDRLDGALESAWTGEWYLRAFDGRGGGVGQHHLFLDAQVWAVIAGHGPVERRQGLVETMGRLLDDPSPIGPTIIDRPHEVRLGMLADGWDCNGGVWAALGGLAAWAFALHDPERAWKTLHKQSFEHHRSVFPDVWYGQWSGPDAYNAHFGDRPGETFVQPATPMTEFPVMNSNAHAGPLLGLQATLDATDSNTAPPKEL